MLFVVFPGWHPVMYPIYPSPFDAIVSSKGWKVGIPDSTKMWLESWWWLESLVEGGQIFASRVVVVIWLDWHHNAQRYQSIGPSFELWSAERHLCRRLARWISGGYWWWLAYCHSSSGWNLLKWNRWDYGWLEDRWGWAIALVLPQRSPQKIIVCTRILGRTDCFLGRLGVVTVMSPKTYILRIFISQ